MALQSKNLKAHLGVLILLLTTSCAQTQTAPDEELLKAEARLLKELTFQNQTVRYLDEGAGANILLIHGPSQSIADWLPYIPTLSFVGRMIALELPKNVTADKDLVQWLDEAMDHLNVENYHLVLREEGCALGFSLFRSHSEHVKSLSVIDGSCDSPQNPKDTFSVISPTDDPPRRGAEEKLARLATFEYVSLTPQPKLFLWTDGAPSKQVRVAQNWQGQFRNSEVTSLESRGPAQESNLTPPVLLARWIMKFNN